MANTQGFEEYNESDNAIQSRKEDSAAAKIDSRKQLAN